MPLPSMSMFPIRRSVAAVAVLPLLAVAPAAAQQALERHPPLSPPPADAAIVVATPDLDAADSTPLGVDLAGVHLIGADEDVPLPRTVNGVPVAAIDAALRPYLAQPLSRRLIAEIQTAAAAGTVGRGGGSMPMAAVEAALRAWLSEPLSRRVAADIAAAMAGAEGRASVSPAATVVKPRPGGPVWLGAVRGVPASAVEAALLPYLGRPLSGRLIAEIQAAVARRWREAGFPFVAVTAPPQEISDGVLRLRVVEFQMGAVAVAGTGGEALAAAVRNEPGERIDAAALEEDLEWLNRVPYRRVDGVFAPGDETATSDLTLSVTEGKPWQVYAGWSNTGTELTGRDRFFVGGGAWIAPLNDLTLTWQTTGGDDLWRSPELLWPRSGDFASYLSHAGRLVLPTWPRQELEIAPAFVATRETADGRITFENETFELPVIYRSAVSNIAPGFHAGTVYGGAEFKRLQRTTFFDGIEVASGEAEVFQLLLGWSHVIDGADGARTGIDVRLKTNPGGVLGDNTEAVWAPFSGGRVTDLSYSYVALDLDHSMPLPRGFGWSSRFSGVATNTPLPDTERMALGGSYAVRGYHLEDASVDAGFVWRNEMRAPVFAALGALDGPADALSPYLFFDFGHGVDHFTDRRSTMAGVGGGFDYDLATHAAFGLTAGYALHDAGETEAGDWAVQMRLLSRY